MTLKARCIGLGDMGPIKAQNSGGVFDNSLTNLALYTPGTFGFKVINEGWANIQPNSSSDLISTNIDAALASISAYNAANPSNTIKAHVRIWTSVHCVPSWAWAASLNDGVHTGSLTVADNQDVQTSCGMFWHTAYLAAVNALATALGTKYDGNAVIGGFSMVGHATRTDEPFNVSFDAASITNMQAFGYTDAQMLSAYSSSISAMATAWPTTPIEFILNPVRYLDSFPANPHGTLDDSKAPTIIDTIRSTLGAQGVISHHALQYPLTTHLVPIYNELQSQGVPIRLQTTSGPYTSWDAAVRYAAAIGCDAVELWNGNNLNQSFMVFPPASGVIQEWAALFPSVSNGGAISPNIKLYRGG